MEQVNSCVYQLLITNEWLDHHIHVLIEDVVFSYSQRNSQLSPSAVYASGKSLSCLQISLEKIIHTRRNVQCTILMVKSNQSRRVVKEMETE